MKNDDKTIKEYHKLAGNLSIFYSKLNFCPLIEYAIFTFITIPFWPTALLTTVIDLNKKIITWLTCSLESGGRFVLLKGLIVSFKCFITAIWTLNPSIKLCVLLT